MKIGAAKRIKRVKPIPKAAMKEAYTDCAFGSSAPLDIKCTTRSYSQQTTLKNAKLSQKNFWLKAQIQNLHNKNNEAKKTS
jgi:hypothetical protein